MSLKIAHLVGLYNYCLTFMLLVLFLKGNVSSLIFKTLTLYYSFCFALPLCLQTLLELLTELLFNLNVCSEQVSEAYL